MSGVKILEEQPALAVTKRSKGKSRGKPAKLAYLGSAIPALSSTFIYREIMELERRGYSVMIYSLRRPDPRTLSAEALPIFQRGHFLLPVSMGSLISAHARFLFRNPPRYVTALFKMVFANDLKLKNRFRSLMHFGEGVVLARQMEEAGITHVHSHYATQPTSVARIVHLLTGIPYSFSAHAYDIWNDRLLLREKLREATFVACCSAFGRTELLKQGDPDVAPKVHVVYHGIDIRRFIPPKDSLRKRNLILAVGRLDPTKGFHVLIKACNHLKQQGVDFQCRIVGEGEERQSLTAIIQEYGLEETVHLFGAVLQEDLLAHYHEAAMFVLPCVVTEGGNFDGIPNVLVEAMATALPMGHDTCISGGVPELPIEE